MSQLLKTTQYRYLFHTKFLSNVLQSGMRLRKQCGAKKSEPLGLMDVVLIREKQKTKINLIDYLCMPAMVSIDI